METGRVAELTAVEPGQRAMTIEALHQHSPVLLAAVRVITLDDDEAADIVQATFEIAIHRADSLREPAALRAWLLRIATREAFRSVRRLRRIISLDRAVIEIAAPTGSRTAAEHLDVRRALMTLPRRTRAAVSLHHLAGLSVRETAEALGVSENTIKTQLKSGLTTLREVLRDD